MRIAIIADPIDEQYAGIHVYAREFIEALERQNPGHEIVYIHLEPNAFFQKKREKIIPLKRSIPLWATIRKFFLIPWYLRREKFDLVHDLSHIAPFTFWGGGYQRVVTIHDLTPVLFPQWHILASRVVHRLIFPFLFQRADLILADSESTKRDILAHYQVRGRLETVLLAGRRSVQPVKSEQARAWLQENYALTRPYLLYVGTLEPRKNLGWLLRLYQQLRERGDFTGQLVLVGKKGWFLQTFESTLSQMPEEIREDIVLTDYVEESHLGYFYSACSLFVYPSFYEGFGLPPLEAMQCGAPVLAADNSSITEVVGEGGILLPLEELEPWIEAAGKVLSDHDTRARLAQSGRDHAATFDWDQHARTVLNLYESIVFDHDHDRPQT